MGGGREEISSTNSLVEIYSAKSDGVIRLARILTFVPDLGILAALVALAFSHRKFAYTVRRLHATVRLPEV